MLYAANGTAIRTYGTKLVTVDFGLRRRLNWTFTVADVSHILGADFLCHFNLLPDLRGRKLIDEITNDR